jgi:hypothetical protein
MMARVSARNEYADWIRHYLKPRHPDLVPEFTRMVNAFDRAITSRALTTRDLQTILHCARSSRQPLGENASVLLGRLARRFGGAAEAVKTMSEDAKSRVRINALVALGEVKPRRFHDSILRTLLSDRSSTVRTLAADKIANWGLVHLLPELEATLAREPAGKCRDALTFCRDLLKPGSMCAMSRTAESG